MINKTFTFFVRGLKASEVRGQIHRILSIASLLIAIGVCVVLTFAFMFRLQVVVVAFSGVLSMALAFYLFVRLWPQEAGEEESVRRVDKVRTAIRQKRPQKTMTPLEILRQRELAQKMIREKAAPALAKAIRGILAQDQMAERKAGGR